MKLLSVLFFLFLQTSIFAKPTIVVSILPQKTFVDKIAQGMAEVTVMVPQGASPHSYEPKVSQMVALSKADIYFSIGVEFEEAWLDKFKSQNKTLKFIDMNAGIEKIEMVEHHHEHEHEHQHDHDEMDPHVWTSPSNVAVMAQTIYISLTELDPKHQQFYKKNLLNFLEEINKTDLEIKEIFKDTKPDTSFMVFHPSWGYFAKEYHLKQVSVEVEGKSPKPKEMINIIEEAKEEDVKVIFTQPEFSDKSAQTIAKETGVIVKKISPLNPQWSQNLIQMARAIADK
ncbi:metal ABC transporter solute-binding protein, Zn/Mn family [Sulfurimonas sp.]|uniref:metal ABC transporter solute-binding protein, Zn/Mn family n=1 Tax=Sulfurimonas sp. TaxID=2022749 RepID=UPI003D138A8E